MCSMPNSARKSDATDLKTPARLPTANNNNNSSSSSNSTPTFRRQPRKKRRIDKEKGKDNGQGQQQLQQQLGECNIEDAKEIDRRLRQVARANSISSEDMHRVVRSVVRNEHVLALVTLKAEDEMARERREAAKVEQLQQQQQQSQQQPQRGAIIITETPSVGKLTRSKARELNRNPGLNFPPLNEKPFKNEIEALIREDLHSDEDDEEYTFTLEDFHSDDDPNTTASDLDSNPCTPQTPLTANEESPIKFTADGCFKLPPDKNTEDPRIATRTRSKLCLQQTTIEDLQSEFVPPDVEQSDVLEYDMTANDAEWMQFLNDFAKPLNHSFLGDDDDPINDPEYVAGEIVPVDAEELRDVNISKKELTDLVSELFAGLLQEGVSLDSIELETPQKFLSQVELEMEQTQLLEESAMRFNASLDAVQQPLLPNPSQEQQHFVNIPTEAIAANPPVPVGSYYVFTAPLTASTPAPPLYAAPPQPAPPPAPALEPYDTNFSWKYLSISKHIFAEYEQQFEQLRHLKPPPADPTPGSPVKGFTPEQHDLLQQQLRIHTQMLTQSFLQTYSHPLLYSLAEQPKQMLLELEHRSTQDASFRCWNLSAAIELIQKWERDLNSDEFEEQNKTMMQFINKETDLTEGHARQVPRLPPRIMDLMLDSQVFMYPQYLPRMAFQPKRLQFTAYAPSEYQLIAMGLEKHLNAIKASRQPLRKGADPVCLACKRMAKDLLHGKQPRRLFFKVKELCDVDTYNPVKYYFEHGRAPPLKQILWGFEDGQVHTPREQPEILPSAWKYYIEKNWCNKKRVRRTKKELQSRASTAAGTSYLEFVREAVGEVLILPDTVGVAAAPHGSATGSGTQWDTNKGRSPTKASSKPRRSGNKSFTESNQSLIINVNYVFGGEIGANSTVAAGISAPFRPQQSYAENVVNLNRSWQSNSSEPAINYSFDPAAGKLLPAAEKHLQKSAERTKKKSAPLAGQLKRRSRPHCCIYKRRKKFQRRSRRLKSSSTSRSGASLRCLQLITCYGSYLHHQREQYSNCPAVQHYHRGFLGLELYTQLLVDLRMFCDSHPTSQSPSQASSSSSGSPQQQKRQRCEDEARNRRANRQEEMLRHMLQPDSPEERNRKDATFAYNFYEKVEEALLMSNRLEDCHSFNQLLQTFDPKQDKVSDLYLKVEKLLLPDYPELAEVFLNFLLPAEAAELGKFFEYFMITNASNFINKLNVYFSKQPAQIRKIYACLSELAELPSVSMKKVEARILPLLKGNQFLCDWFVQQFPQARPPQLLLPPAEKTNLHEMMANTSGEFAETLHDVPDETPVQGKAPACQLRYLNGRIFYGSKIMLPAKLSFRAASIYNEQCHDALTGDPLSCAHGGVRVLGEKLISAAAAVDSDDAADRSEEDDASRSLVIDTTTTMTTPTTTMTTTGEDENSGSSVDTCDDAALRAHAIRLNGSYYNSSFNNTATSTPNITHHHHHQHHPNAKKTAINFGEISPRRQTGSNISPVSGLSPLPAAAALSPQPSDKRKSPNKKVRSPQSAGTGQLARPRYNLQPMVVIHGATTTRASPAIEFAKRLRTLIGEEETQANDEMVPEEMELEETGQEESAREESMFEESTLEDSRHEESTLEVLTPKGSTPEEATPKELALEESADNKMNIQIIAQAKHNPSTEIAKLEQDPKDELSPFVAIKMDVEAELLPAHVITTQFDSDEDCKLDVVASLANCSVEQDMEVASVAYTNPSISPIKPAAAGASSAAWTREEDKVILIEMKRGARDREHLIKRMGDILRNRNELELRTRHQFLMDFLSKLQGK